MKNFRDLWKFLATVFSWTAFLFLILIGIALLYYVFSAQIYARKGQEFEPPFALYTIISGSMEKELMIYDVVLNFKVTDPNKIKTGDIITFTSTSSLNPGMTVTHRVLERIETDHGIVYRTKGDNNLTADSSTVPFENVKGKTFMKIPQLGRVQFLLASKGGWFFAILVPAMGLIIYDILKLFKVVGVKKKIDKSNEDDTEDPEKIKRENIRKEELKKTLAKEEMDETNDLEIRKKIISKYGDLSDDQIDKLVDIIKEKKGK